MIWLDKEKIVCILDNDPNKHGRRLYGSDLKVFPPSVLKDVSSPFIILKAGVYNEEIKTDIYKNINPDAVFFE